MCGRLKLFPQFSPNLVHCQPPVEQFVLFPNQLHLGTALEGAPQIMNRLLLGITTFLFLTSISAVAQCPDYFKRQLNQTSIAEGGYLVLRKTPSDSHPFLIQEDCVIIGSSFWPKGQRSRYLYLGVVNYVPSEEEPDVSYLAIQASRINPDAPGHDLIRVYRPSGWIRQTDDKTETLKKVPGKVVPLTLADWIKLHSTDSDDVGLADKAMQVKWHGQPAEDTPSSWELRENWREPQAYQNGTFLTNFLLRFKVNRDENQISVIPFEIGLPADANEVTISVRSNIDAIKQTVRFQFR
jgi:hypothetical protein